MNAFINAGLCKYRNDDGINGAVCNLVLDPILFLKKMSVQGAALAMVILCSLQQPAG